MFPPANCKYTRGKITSVSLYVPTYQTKWLVVEVLFDAKVVFNFVCRRMDATLKELTSLVKEVYPEARKKGTHFSFAIVYPDPRGKMYKYVSHKHSSDWVHADSNILQLKWHLPSRHLQVEGHRQHCIRQEGRGWLHDVAVSALPDRGLPGHSHHTAQQSPAPWHTHETFLNMLTHRRASSSVQVFSFASFWMVLPRFIKHDV